MQVAVAAVDDIPSWLALAAEVEPLFGPMVDDPGFLRALRETIERGDAYCVRENDGPPGTGLLAAMMFGCTNASYKIGWLAVSERSRRKGLGRMLVEHALGMVASPATITVTTFREDEPSGRPARRLYESVGFEPGEMRESHGFIRQVFTKTL